MKIFDISWPVSSEMTFYKDRPGFSVEQTKTFEVDHARECRFTVGSHTGTHIDAPAHFLKDGLTIDALSPELFVGDALVIDCTAAETHLTSAHFAPLPNLAGKIVLFKTRNSLKSPTDRFSHDYIYLSGEAASFLVAQKVKAVGIDYLGIERAQADHATHKGLLAAGVGLIEGLRLGHVEPGSYFFVGLPLLLMGADGAPARAILMQKP